MAAPLMLKKKKTFSKLFPTPEYLLISTAGVSITDTGIKLVQFHRRFLGAKLKLAHYAGTSLPEGTIQSGFINDAEKLTAALRDIAGLYGINKVYATLPEERAYLFSAIIEKVPDEGLRDAVAFIIEENVPVSLADSVFDFEIVEELPAARQIKVTVSVLSRKVVDFYLQVFEAAGVTPVSFDIESQAIARAIVAAGDKRAQLIINLGEKKTGLYIVEDEVVQFTTTLPYGVVEDPANPHLKNLKAEINKIFDFWASRAGDQVGSARSVERVLLCGVGAYQEAFVKELMEGCPVEYALADAWSSLSLDAKAIPTELSKQSLDYLAALGSAYPHFEKNHV